MLYDVIDMTDKKKELIMEINKLSNSSKKEILFFLQVLDLNSTSNTNGNFFLISDVPSNVVDDIYEKVKRLQSFEARNSIEVDNNANDLENKNVFSNENIAKNYADEINKNLPFKCDQNVLNILNATKMNSKKSSSKYCMTMKRYTKPVVKDALKIDEYDLSEFQIEEYIL